MLDNVWLGTDGLRNASRAREKRERARRVLEELLGRAARPRHAGRGALAERPAGLLHRARAAAASRAILILDEATSALDVATRDRLFADLGAPQRDGVGVIFITHRMDEIDEIGDRITVHALG